MSTFLEFYIALVRFVNHKLYVDLGLKHPLDIDVGLNENNIYLNV